MFKIERCYSYDEKDVGKALDNLVDLNAFVKKGETVLVKPNLLDAFTPEKAVTTHPALVKAVVVRLQKLGAKVIIADSPQKAFNESRLKKVYEVTGMQAVADETGCELNYETTHRTLPSKTTYKEFEVMTVVDGVDKVINLCKVKTHLMAKFTCATKNLYGYVPGWTKMKYHMQTDMGKFAPLLLELEEYKTPVLSIADGVVGMEGQGPSSGTPKKLGLLIAGTNVYEMDYNICKIIGVPPLEVLYLKRALEQKKFKENTKSFSEYLVPFAAANIIFPFNVNTKEY